MILRTFQIFAWSYSSIKIFFISSIELQEQKDGIDWFFIYLFIYFLGGRGGWGYFEFLAQNAPKIKFFKFYENCVISTIFIWVSWWFVSFSISLRCHHGWCQDENFENFPFWISRDCHSGFLHTSFTLLLPSLLLLSLEFLCYVQYIQYNKFSRDTDLVLEFGISLPFNWLVFHIVKYKFWIR